MGRLIVGTFVSLDGVMQGPGEPDEDRDDGFAYGGWLVPHIDEASTEAVVALYMQVDGFVLGRRSYDILAGHWPRVTGDDPLAAKLNSAPKYLVSRTRASGDWAPTTVVPDGASGIADLKARTAGDLQVIGSANLIQTLLAHGLVNEFRLWTFPVVLGPGKRLFGEGTAPAGLTLVDSSATATGVTLRTYVVEGEPRTGSFALDAPED